VDFESHRIFLPFIDMAQTESYHWHWVCMLLRVTGCRTATIQKRWSTWSF